MAQHASFKAMLGTVFISSWSVPKRPDRGSAGLPTISTYQPLWRLDVCDGRAEGKTEGCPLGWSDLQCNNQIGE